VAAVCGNGRVGFCGRCLAEDALLKEAHLVLYSSDACVNGVEELRTKGVKDFVGGSGSSSAAAAAFIHAPRRVARGTYVTGQWHQLPQQRPQHTSCVHVAANVDSTRLTAKGAHALQRLQTALHCIIPNDFPKTQPACCWHYTDLQQLSYRLDYPLAAAEMIGGTQVHERCCLRARKSSSEAVFPGAQVLPTGHALAAEA
jgi:hypothetical protein